MFSKGVGILISIYIAYYALIILYDLFIKKTKTVKVFEEDIIDVSGEYYENPSETDDSYVIPEKKTVTSIKDEARTPALELEQEQDSSLDFIDLDIESQGIPFELLMKEGKSMFAGVNF